MLLRLTGTPAASATLGPAEWFRLKGNELIGPNGRTLLHYEGGYWKDHTQVFTSILCEGPVRCRFEGADGRVDEPEGPFQTLTLVSAVLWGDDVSLARFDVETGRWLLLAGDGSAAALVWLPASALMRGAS